MGEEKERVEKTVEAKRRRKRLFYSAGSVYSAPIRNRSTVEVKPVRRIRTRVPCYSLALAQCNDHWRQCLFLLKGNSHPSSRTIPSRQDSIASDMPSAVSIIQCSELACKNVRRRGEHTAETSSCLCPVRHSTLCL